LTLGEKSVSARKNAKQALLLLVSEPVLTYSSALKL